MSRKPIEKKGISQEWLTTYSDMVTLILTFFVLLYSFSLVDNNKFKAVATSLANALKGSGGASILEFNMSSGNVPIVGDSVPGEIAAAHEAVRQVSANCMALCQTGTSYKDILEEHKVLLSEFGCPDEWRGHYPGGRTGYFICQAGHSLDPKRRITDTEAFEWFITVSGAKTAELTVKDGENITVASNTGLWPSRDITRHGKTFPIPEIMLR
jgi:hypothetical protein